MVANTSALVADPSKTASKAKVCAREPSAGCSRVTSAPRVCTHVASVDSAGGRGLTRHTTRVLRSSGAGMRAAVVASPRARREVGEVPQPRRLVVRGFRSTSAAQQRRHDSATRSTRPRAMATSAFSLAVPLALASRGSTRRVARARARVVSAAHPDAAGGGQAAGARGRVAPLLVTSTNDLLDAVLTRALHAPVDPDARPREGEGTHRAHDADLLDALAHRAPELTGSEAADLLWAVSCAPRFSTLPRNATGRLLDALVHREGPFAPLHKLYLDESLPLAWMRPAPRRPSSPPARRRRARAPRSPERTPDTARAEPARERPDDEADVHADLDYKATPAPERTSSEGMNVDAWSGAPPRAGWHMPYDYSVRDVARVAHALASFPPPLDQTAADDRALTARAVAHLTARFSRDEWTREKTPAEILALLAWSFGEMPAALSSERGCGGGGGGGGGGGDAAVVRGAIDGPVDFRKSARRAMRELAAPVRRHADDFTPREIIALVCAYEKTYDDCWLENEPRREPRPEPERAGSSDDSDSAARADGRAAANHVLQALVPRVLRDTSAYTSRELGYVADACARFGVHPKREGIWNWTSVILRRRREEERDEAEGEEEEDEEEDEDTRV